MAKELTEKQRRVVQVIRSWIREQGYPPTIRELGKLLGIKSLRGVTTHLDALAKKGQLDRKRGARGIRLLVDSTGEGAVRIPIVGRIAAGTPVLADEHIEGHVLVDVSLMGKAPSDDVKHFALRVKGTSMQGAGIMDGDYVIVRQQPNAENGEIVAIRLGDEATVKRFYRENDSIRLQPEHPDLQPIILDAGQSADILGKVIAVFRQLSG